MKIVDVVLILAVLIKNVVATETDAGSEEGWMVVGTPKRFYSPDLRNEIYNIQRSEDEMTGILYSAPFKGENEGGLPEVQANVSDSRNKLENLEKQQEIFSRDSDGNDIHQFCLFPISVDEMTGIPEIKYTNYFEHRYYSEKDIKKIFDKMDMCLLDSYDPLQFVKKSSLSFFRYIYENKWYAGMIFSFFAGVYGVLRIT